MIASGEAGPGKRKGSDATAILDGAVAVSDGDSDVGEVCISTCHS